MLKMAYWVLWTVPDEPKPEEPMKHQCDYGEWVWVSGGGGGGGLLSGCERSLMGAQVSMIMVNGESSTSGTS